MNRVYRLIAGSLLLMIPLSVPSYGWDDRGHMMVAAVAYQKLTPKTKDRVDALLMLNPDRVNWFALIPPGTSAARTKMMIFVIAATWPDRIKSDPDYHSDGPHGGNRPPNDPSASQNIGFDDFARHKYWHFVDMPFSQDGTALPVIPTPNAQERITVFRAVLASTSADPLKAYDLSWLLHLVGDVHQPLHCVTRVSAASPEGDDGGNGVKLNAPATLHAFWDDALGTDKSPATAITAAAHLAVAPAGAASDLTVQHWIDESVSAAKSTAYRKPTIGDGNGPFTLDSAYKMRATALAQKRVALAGARLAKILNEELQ
jgi:hypothetical protein